MIVLCIPIPPSVNASTKNAKKGRRKTDAYKAWLVQADKHLLTQKRGLCQIRGECEVLFQFPKTMKGDVSNRIKLAEDFLASREITGDDKHNWRVTAERADVDCCVITITERFINPMQAG